MEQVEKKTGTVYLIGAGPGDPGLITARGISLIGRAEVVVYDRLVNPVLLNYAPPGARFIYAGKSPECHTMKQEEINETLVTEALAGNTVARLKGGDPYLFARGGEEALCLAQRNIPFEIIPGVTSALAVPAYAGIPVTHRDYTSGLTIITGHEDPARSDARTDWAKVSAGTGTLVILMGIANLSFIVSRLTAHGRSPDTPVAVIRHGSTPEQQTVIGTLKTIAGQVKNNGIKPPAIIIVGEVVTLRPMLRWYEEKPLFGRRIIVTRPRQQVQAFCEAISELGGEPLPVPVIRIEPPDDFAPLDRALHNLQSYQMIIFTSVNGVGHFLGRMRQLGKDIREMHGVRLGAIGPRTKAALENTGMIVELLPSSYRAEAILALVEDKIRPGDRVLLPRADLARPLLATGLAEYGAEVDDLVAYHTRPETGEAEKLKEILSRGKGDMVTFTSSSTVDNFISILGDGYKELLDGVQLASIGPVTSATIAAKGLPVHIEASEFTVDGLLKAILGQK